MTQGQISVTMLNIQITEFRGVVNYYKFWLKTLSMKDVLKPYLAFFGLFYFQLGGSYFFSAFGNRNKESYIL